MKKVATIILNRNLPEPTNKLFEFLTKEESNLSDIFIIEAGSNKNNLSKYYTWHENSPEVIKNGLRFPRGMNYGLRKLYESGKYQNYEAFFLITNDTEFLDSKPLSKMMEIMGKHERLGLLSPCSKRWGEFQLLSGKNKTKYFWHIQNTAYLIKKDLIDTIGNFEKNDSNKFLFDGENFRGFCSESELIAKSYINDWAAAITSEVSILENEQYLLSMSNIINTENYEINLKLYIEEGRAWMKKKYGFQTRWSMNQYTKLFYDKFFEYYPELAEYKI